MLKLEVHPLNSGIVNEDAAFDAFCRDIESRGQLVPVMAVKGKVNGDYLVFDGKRRLAACKKLGIVAKYQTWEGDADSLPEVIAALKLHREHLGPSQRAAWAVEMEPRFASAARERQGKLQKTPGKSNIVANLPQCSDGGTERGDAGRARDLVADLFGISARSVQDAKKVLAHSADLHAQILSGKINVNQAMAIIRREERLKDLRHAARANKSGARLERLTSRWEIRTGDSLRIMPTLPRRKVRLIVADPPYNIGVDYGNEGWGDRMPRDQYLRWSAQWVEGCAELLTPDGSFWIVINDDWAAHFVLMLEQQGLHRRSWVKWYEKFGSNCANNFNRTSRHLLYFTRDPKQFVFNPDAVMRRSDRQSIYHDARANPTGKIMDDVWDIPRLVGNSAERLPTFPTQLPLDLIRPIIGACSNAGDEVFDPFNGSGTTGAAAIAAGRNYLGIELNPKFAELSRARLSQIQQPTKGSK